MYSSLHGQILFLKDVEKYLTEDLNHATIYSSWADESPPLNARLNRITQSKEAPNDNRSCNSDLSKMWKKLAPSHCKPQTLSTLLLS